MKPRFAVLALALLAAVTSGCANEEALTKPFLTDTAVSALVGLESGSLRYAQRVSGEIWEADANGIKAATPLARITDLRATDDAGVLSLAVDAQDRTFASWITGAGDLVVGQVAPGPVRLVWQGPKIGTDHVGGDLSFTPTDRLLVAVGDQGQPNAASNPDVLNGKLLTLDPNRSAPQQPNIISSSWSEPSSVIYDQAATLWVGQANGNNAASINRLSTNGSIASTATVEGGGRITGFTRYGEQEFAACLSGTRSLTRYFLKDREAVPGRTMATDCIGDVTQMKNGTLAYVSDSGIRVTT